MDITEGMIAEIIENGKHMNWIEASELIRHLWHNCLEPQEKREFLQEIQDAQEHGTA